MHTLNKKFRWFVVFIMVYPLYEFLRIAVFSIIDDGCYLSPDGSIAGCDTFVSLVFGWMFFPGSFFSALLVVKEMIKSLWERRRMKHYWLAYLVLAPYFLVTFTPEAEPMTFTHMTFSISLFLVNLAVMSFRNYILPKHPE